KRLQQSKYLDFLILYFKLGKKEWEAYRAYKQKQNQEEVAEVELISSILKKEGWEEAKVEEGQDMLLRLFPKKLGPVPAGDRKRESCPYGFGAHTRHCRRLPGDQKLARARAAIEWQEQIKGLIKII
ncbi:MAG: hypothetical protein ACE5I1_17445, partial [bacterium]